jgi:hypothetical protein
VEHITDPVLGTLEHDGYGWEGHLYLEAFQNTLPLSINASSAYPPDEEERSVIQAFLARQHELKIALEHAVFDYYNQNLEVHRNWRNTPEQALEFVPNLREPQDVWTQIEALRIQLDFSSDDRLMLSIAFSARWDSDHGVDVTFLDDKIGVAEGGANWSDQTHYDLEGEKLA